jgi:lipopolysaccharide export system protein LptA
MLVRLKARSRALSTRYGIAALAFALLLGGSPAQAQGQKNQGPPNALQGFSQNKDEPVRIRAATLEVRDKEQQATFSGDVQVVQGDTELRCKSLVVFYDDDQSVKVAKAGEAGPAGQRQIRKIEARGGVTVTQKDQKAVGDTATFDMRANLVTLLGNVLVTRSSGEVLRGHRLLVDLASGVTKMDSGRVEALIPRGPDRK